MVRLVQVMPSGEVAARLLFATAAKTEPFHATA
jgi:hypothetical protein